MNFVDLQAGLKALIASLTELPVDQVVWFDEATPDPVGEVAAIARVQVYGLVNVGQGGESRFREAVENDNGPLFETVRRQKALTLRVRVESYDVGTPARQWLMNLDSKLTALSTSIALEAIGLAYQQTLTYQDVSKTSNGRVTSWAIVDVRMNAADTWTDPTQYSRITSGVFDPTYKYQGDEDE